jgi:hypothetical protein
MGRHDGGTVPGASNWKHVVSKCPKSVLENNCEPTKNRNVAKQAKSVNTSQIIWKFVLDRRGMRAALHQAGADPNRSATPNVSVKPIPDHHDLPLVAAQHGNKVIPASSFPHDVCPT